ncbi:outer membrane porin GjpA [[Mycobacterium] nativiensis]|uniref:Outer membrane porin GjpA n=1 Tax=[Mycobacterium] nativiensis TaxID=2855503 RepID=A0ABU5Y1H8_9MYCO|nr:outer membrane porin GjpA [Mycolicibacter sp. MYC340]MEB3034096.1 outer membrane porin GjpA [Mycolicibacter sp. MYC340]
MQHVLRPYVTAGVAVLGASMIAATPVVAAPLLPAAHVNDVVLTAGLDFTTAWEDVFATAKANSDTLQAAAADAQAALKDAMTANPDWASTDPQEVLAALTFLGGDQKGFLNPLSIWSVSDGLSGHQLLYYALTGQFPADLFPAPGEQTQDLINFATSPLSAVLIGALGPSIAPMVALNNGVQDIIGNISGDNPDWEAALQGMVNLPANMLGGFLNGATLDLKDLIPLIEQANIVPLPEGTTLNDVSIAFGGLLSPGLVSANMGEGVGGSIFNALGLNLSGVPILNEMDVIGQGVGPMGAWLGLEQILAHVLDGSLPWGDAELPADAAASLSAVDFADLFNGDWLSSVF